MRSPGVILVTSGCLLTGSGVQAQDALRNALQLAPMIGSATTAPSITAPETPHLGPVQLQAGTYAGLELNDNVNSSQFKPQSDLLLRAGLSLGLAWPITDESDLRFSSSFGYVHYLRNGQYDHLEVAPNSALAWAIGLQEGSLTFFDQFSYSQQVLAESAIAGLATFPRFSNTVGTQLDWQPGHCAFDLGYSHNNSFSDSSQFQYLDSSAEYFFARAGWRFGETSQAGLEASTGLTRYDLATQNNNESLSLGPYTDWQITQSLRASLRGGAVFYRFDSQPLASHGKQLDDYYLGFEIDHRLTDFLTHKVNLQRDVRQGLNQGSSYIEELTAGYSISYSLTSKVTLGAGFNYEQGSQPLVVLADVFPFGTLPVLSTENYSRYGANLSARWRATERLAASLTYSYWLRDSNLAGLGYKVNSLSLNLSYTF